MADLSLDEKCKAAAQLVQQSPPGEVNDVINGLRTIIADDEALMTHVRGALRTYNLDQLTAVEHPAFDDTPAHTSILSTATILPGTKGEAEKYVDVAGTRSFAFDHITLAVSDVEPYELPEEEEAFRAELAKSLSAYTKNHFPAGLSVVSCSQHPLLPPAPPVPAAGTTSESTDAAVADEITEKPEKDVSAVEETDSADETKEAGEPVTDAQEAKESKEEAAVTDVVPEQVGGGDNEPDPTPAVGNVPKEEVDQPGGLEKVDEKVEDLKEKEKEEEQQQTGGASATSAEVEAEGKSAVQLDEPQVEEEGGAVAKSEPSAPAAPAVEERKQERIENPVYTLEVVGNRYNTSNFWTGRWRTRWVVDQSAGKVEGNIHVDVHYYEQGNVQLATKHTASFPCPVQANGSQSIASQIVTTIAKIETNYQLELNDVYDQLGEKAFRALRRALPVTRQKMDWDKVGGYSLGSDLGKARS